MDLPGIVVGEDDRVGAWVAEQIGCEWFPGKGRTVGLEDANGQLTAGAIYEDYSGTNVFVHQAVSHKHAGTKAFLFYAFYYPFVELGCDRVTGLVKSTNKEAVNLNIRLGMELEAVLYGACEGGHILVYRMFKKDCKWLSLGDKYGQQ